jgi:hypothetical protein
MFIFDEYSTEISCSYSTNIREYEYEYEYVEYSPIPDISHGNQAISTPNDTRDPGMAFTLPPVVRLTY